jgi:hypothetical protein
MDLGRQYKSRTKIGYDGGREVCLAGARERAVPERAAMLSRTLLINRAFTLKVILDLRRSYETPLLESTGGYISL